MTQADHDRAHDNGWAQAHASYETAWQLAHDAAIRSLRKGRTVAWEHGQHLRRGTIIDHSIRTGYSNFRVKVRLASGKTTWIYAANIRRELLGR